MSSIPLGETAKLNSALHQVTNIAYALRLCLRFLIQTLSEENVLPHLSPPPIDTTVNNSTNDGDQQGSAGKSADTKALSIEQLEKLLTTCMKLLTDTPVSKSNYILHVESISIILILLSVQMYSLKPAHKSVIYRVILSPNCSTYAPYLCKVLLTNFIEQIECPKFEGGSIIIGLASGVWNVLSLGYGKQEASDVPKDCLLARLSVMLLLVLTNHCTAGPNAYRTAMFNCCDVTMKTNTNNTDESVNDENTFKIEFAKLFDTLAHVANDDQTTLLLYTLLHKNILFRNYIISKTSDLDMIVVPILRILYDSSEKSSHHVYMALIILLILSEDKLFDDAIHTVQLKTILWYKEKQLSSISLGGLMVLVIIRTLRFNISRSKDKFLHTNLLATLGNLSGSFKHLNPYACQQIVVLFEKLAKRFSKALTAVNSIQSTVPANGITVDTAAPSGSGSDRASEADAAEIADYSQNLSIYEEVLRMILEIINSCLASQLVNNPDLIYTLLYKRHIFEPFQSNPSFQDVISNIELVLSYFSNLIPSDRPENPPSVDEVKEIIDTASKKWPSEKLKVSQPLLSPLCSPADKAMCLRRLLADETSVFSPLD